MTIARPGEPTPTRTATPIDATRDARPARRRPCRPRRETRTATPVRTATPDAGGDADPHGDARAHRDARAGGDADPHGDGAGAPRATPHSRTATPGARRDRDRPPVASPTPSPAPAAIDGVRAAACQRAILKAGRTLVTRTLAALDDCAGAVSACEPPRRRTAGCRERAGTACAQARGSARAAARATFVAARDRALRRCGAGRAARRRRPRIRAARVCLSRVVRRRSRRRASPWPTASPVSTSVAPGCSMRARNPARARVSGTAGSSLPSSASPTSGVPIPTRPSSPRPAPSRPAVGRSAGPARASSVVGSRISRLPRGARRLS